MSRKFKCTLYMNKTKREQSVGKTYRVEQYCSTWVANVTGRLCQYPLFASLKSRIPNFVLEWPSLVHLCLSRDCGIVKSLFSYAWSNIFTTTKTRMYLINYSWTRCMFLWNQDLHWFYSQFLNPSWLLQLLINHALCSKYGISIYLKQIANWKAVYFHP